MAMKKWKRKLTEVKNLRQRAAELIYDRVVLLVQVYQDPEFLTDEGLDQLTAAARLDDEVADVCASFLELKAVLEFYPNRKQWQGRRLDLIRDEVLAAERERHAASKEPKSVKRVTKAEYDELEQTHRKSLSEIERLRAENQELREQIGALKFRIHELESLLNPAEVAA